MSTNDQIDVVARFKNGDSQAFEEIHHLFIRPLYYFVRQLVGDDLEAQDIVSETFRKLWSRKEHLESLTNIKAFLFITARNNGIDYLRYKKRHERSKKEFVQNMDVKEEAIINKIVETELLEEAFKRINELPEKAQTIMTLHYKEGLSLKQIAEQLNTSQEAVRISKFRAIAEIRKFIKSKNMLFLVVIFKLQMLQ